MNNSFLEKFLNQDFGVLALIDPDFKNDDILDELINSINMNNFSGVLVGGSTISDKNYPLRIKKIKKYINKPLILFPGSSEQISKYADAILFTTLLSGRNPKYLIEEQIKGVERINNYKLTVISTGYLLIASDHKTSVETTSQTTALDPNDFSNILNHVLVAEYFGMKFVYLEMGSGAKYPVSYKLVNHLTKKVKIPIIVGGGIKHKDQLIELKEAGAKYVVLSTVLEQNPNVNDIASILP
tara:strand:- start:1055 stop:1777 length:723 start_codon:yes stop_codon:yes gene_type:complete